MGYFGAVFGALERHRSALGGLFTQHLSWRWVFYINLPIGIVALFVSRPSCTSRSIEPSTPSTTRASRSWAPRSPSIILLTTWGGTTYPGLETDPGARRHVGVLATRVLPGRALRRRAAHPLGLFRIGVFSVSSTVGLLVGLIMFGAIIYIPLYLQTVFGASPTAPDSS